MPIYEYHCRECDNKFERLVSMSTQDIDIQCPACQQNDVEKVLSVFAGKMAHAPTAPASAGCSTCSTSFRGG
jgi:putative FmdB family regulatory protein